MKLVKYFFLLAIVVASTNAMAAGCRVINKTDGWWLDSNNASCKIKWHDTGFSLSYYVPDGYFMSWDSNTDLASVSQSSSSAGVTFRTGPYVGDEIEMDSLGVGTYVKFYWREAAKPKPKKENDRQP